MSFGGSFWNFLNFAQSSQIDTSLSDPNTTLEDLLNDENILSEFKNLNPKLLKYCTDDKIKQMISYIVEEPPGAEDKDRGYKFPFISCEILTADVETLLEAFFDRNPNNLRNQSVDSEYSSREIKDESDTSQNKSIDSDKEDNDNENKEETIGTTEEENKNDEKKEEEDKNVEETEEKPEVEEKNQPQKEEEKVEKEESHEQEKTEESIEQGEVVKLEPGEIAKYFFSFLDVDNLNVTLVGYFSRFLMHLINRKPKDIYNYVWKNSEIIDRLIFHLDHKSLAECLAKLFLLEPQTNTIDEFIDKKIEKLKKLTEVFNTDTENLNNETIADAAFVLTEILSKKSTLHNKGAFDSYLSSKDFLDILFINAFRSQILTTHLTSVLNVLVLQHLHNDTLNQSLEEDEKEKSEPKKTNKEADDYFYDCLVSKAGDIVESLKRKPEAERTTTFGATQTPLGTTRLRLIELVASIFRLDVPKVSLEFANKDLFQTLMDLIVQYEWNNFLHNFVEKIFVSTLENESHELRKKLLDDASLIEFLTQSTEDVNYTIPNSQQRKIRKGYLGHLTRIGSMLQRLGEADKEIKEYLNNPKWTQFNEKYLEVTLKKDNSDLASSDRKGSEDFKNNEAFFDFQPNLNIEQFRKKKEEFGGPEQNNENEAEDDFNDRDDDFKGQGNDFASNDIFSKYGNTFEEWGKEEQSGEPKKNTKDLWNISPADFKMTFFFDNLGFRMDNKEDQDKFLELNRKLEIIDIGPQHETKLEQDYFDNAFWARPKREDHNIDDIMKEFDLH